MAIAPVDFTRKALTAAGFVGWRRFSELSAEQLPRAGGVYIVLRPSSDPPAFLEVSPAGWFKQRDPTVPTERLSAEWVEGAPTIYIGTATDLHTRLTAYQRHGAGQSVGHWGGRFIWQCCDAADLLVAWRPTETDESPAVVESQLLTQFASQYGRLPFANLRR